MEPGILLKRAVAMVLFLLIVVAYIVVPNIPSDEEVGDGSITPYSRSADGGVTYDDCTSFRKMIEGEGGADYDVYTIVGSPTILRDIEEPERTLYVVLGVEREYKPADVDILMDFYERGGKLIIADDFGHGNSFSDEFNVHFYGKRMYDVDKDWNNSFPRIKADLDLEEYLILMDHPSGLMTRPGDPNIEVIANGSRDSYIDIDDDGTLGINDIMGPVQVIVEYSEPNATGSILFISDPGIFDDDKWDAWGREFNSTQYENWRFVRDLVTQRMLPSGGKVIFDEGRHEPEKQLQTIHGTIETVTILTSNPRELALLMTGMVLIILMGILRAKDKEDWVHRHYVGNISMTPELPETRREIRERLRALVLRKLRMVHGLTREELDSLASTQLASMIKDHDLNELVLNDGSDLSNEDLWSLVKKVRKS